MFEKLYKLLEELKEKLPWVSYYEELIDEVIEEVKLIEEKCNSLKDE